ncbi:Major facilitator superfamily [Kalmanozyma brasiliensis GHG001]|uniref:Putative carboxylic acid transport protein JEN1 n=1 Tax=Kalmanozyma brasiliensis (strain GHG001) TaxID=1365824 RepID=V5EMV7_KALBG|nr:Major facilitator superfamily [Kalmanozyma brasiliensis GHG001]EST06465.1 Major facilitator superfamily [Kalmanozyma brasiliensis GHG001]
MNTEAKKGVLAQGAQNFKDLFHWKVRSTIIDENGEEQVVWEKPSLPPNPFRLITMLGLAGWGAYLIGFSAWTADAFDFHALSIQTTKLAKHFGVSKTKITEAITLTLLLRSVGAAVFGIFSDYFGRKYPLVINMWCLGALQVASIYCRTFNEFLAVRALFGLFMGGVYGAASSMALENIPSEARGLFSGIYQQGYSFGYVLAACVNLGVGGATNTWPTMFWVGAGFSFVVGFLRLAWPESKQFIEARKASKGSGTKNFRKSFTACLRAEWKVCLFAIVLMSWFNWFSHSSQDSYTTFMLVGKRLNNTAASRASILMKTGACVGGTIWGYMSQWIGRRRAMIVACLVCCCLIPAWVLPTSEKGLEAGGFLLQAMVQGAWGVVPIYLAEISPPAFRAIFVGLTYQLGNAISSPSTQLINYLSENNFITFQGRRVEAYGPVMAIATAIIALGLAATASVGPEKKGARFERAAAATAEVQPQLLVYQKEFDTNSETKSVDLTQTQTALSK